MVTERWSVDGWTDGWWNGLPTKIRHITGIVVDWDPDKDPPQAWWRDLSGVRVNAVEVVLDGVNQGGGVDILWDDDGSGWAKVTEGHGSPRWPHRNIRLTDIRPAAKPAPE